MHHPHKLPVHWTSDVANVGRGLLMGSADIVPGVSGGTVALILGIYERLVTALSRVDGTLLAHLRHGRWRAAAEHLDLRFLLTLGAGIVLGIVSLAGVMHHLLTHHPQPVWAAFFGLILASSLLVGRLVGRLHLRTAACGLAGAAFAYWLVGLVPMNAPDHLGYVFLSGTIAICAMILPGISGAFILVILGEYLVVTGALKSLVKISGGGLPLRELAICTVFAAGCAVGLIAFSKVLKTLLSRWGEPTMAALCGFMLGSLRKIWPFKEDLTPEVTDLSLKQYRNTLPDSLAEAALPLALLVGAAVLVLVLDYAARRVMRARHQRQLSAAPQSTS